MMGGWVILAVGHKDDQTIQVILSANVRIYFIKDTYNRVCLLLAMDRSYKKFCYKILKPYVSVVTTPVFIWGKVIGYSNA